MARNERKEGGSGSRRSDIQSAVALGTLAAADSVVAWQAALLRRLADPVCAPKTGSVLGMVTSGLTVVDVSLSITFAIPSEVLQPFADAISFKADDGELWQ